MILLLTACINPIGISDLKIVDPEERLMHYKSALDFYLKKSNFNIVFVENTNTNLNKVFKEFLAYERIEFLSFDGDQYDKSKGKGFGEGLILKYAFENSSFIKNSDYIVKITGRLIIRNILYLLRGTCENDVFIDSNGHFDYIQSQFFCGDKMFYEKYLIPELENIDDSHNIYFEHILAKSVKQWRNSGFEYGPFCQPIYIEGSSASMGTVYRKPSFRQYIVVFLRYVIYKISKTFHVYL